MNIRIDTSHGETQCDVCRNPMPRNSISYDVQLMVTTYDDWGHVDSVMKEPDNKVSRGIDYVKVCEGCQETMAERWTTFLYGLGLLTSDGKKVKHIL